ncbi:hypothetical protein HZR02_17625 [Elizabethkingia anophelis]|uniref:hypothetical protein n=1 Tax=Elizabethkingia anophelis TaxID=1117645 RepID=UPI0021A50A79|nr:hypothetical protein [Elizabethkingia anophelis]MCT3645700.1 hypothetical protein [Elizabethkingia anophelis]MCT3653596.1 hypothetical protein [Elizabethkingia anophelis]MCT3660706.1 hypothetical protein [Elizabethkingia anophelis]MCT3667872.1 hypothetical protein [Elizabethkingia anophelis]MCT3678618.1 hypothetical protein [Elizabethkingia anophelis]
MAEKIGIPLHGNKKVLFAPVTADGSVPLEAAWEELCRTYKNSVEILGGKPTKKQEYCDQQSKPIKIFYESASTEGKFQAYDYDLQTLVQLIGGTVVDNEWTEPEENLGKEIALRFITDSNHQITYAKVMLFGSKNLKLVKDGLALIDCEFEPLLPGKIKKLP